METINFMYWAWNHNQEQLKTVLSLVYPDRPFDKLNHIMRLRKHETTTQGFLYWFMELSDDNKLAVLAWINSNYDYRYIPESKWDSKKINSAGS